MAPKEQNPAISRLRKKAQKVEKAVLEKNIYSKATFNELVRLENDIRAIAAATHLSLEEVINQAGIKPPLQVLNDSMRHWDARLNPSNLPSEDELMRRLQHDFGVKIEQTMSTYVPTDELVFTPDTEPQEPQEPPEDANRLALAIETLLHLDINGRTLKLDDFKIRISKTPKHTWRTRPYWRITIKNPRIAILINNQSGNRTLVFSYKNKSNLETIAESSKEQFKALADQSPQFHHFIYHNPGQFKIELTTAITSVLKGIEITKQYATYTEAQEAAQALKIKTGEEYKQRYKEDPRLPADPYQKYGEAFISWVDFLDREKPKEFYEGYTEAQLAAQALNIKTQKEYGQRYREDRRLPSAPYKKYADDFVSWPDFLDREKPKEFYEGYTEAQLAVQALNIKTAEEYQQRYKEDPRLPAAPNQKYGEAFVGWPDFLRGEKPKEFYTTYAEAQAAAQKLKIQDYHDYLERYKEDPRLPSNPLAKYGEAFISLADFLRNEKKVERGEPYETYAEAQLAAQALNIKTAEEYQQRYKEDPRLPAAPYQKYGEAFISWPDFLRNRKKQYASYADAKTAAQALNIKTGEEYKQRYKEDPRLPSHPDEKYPDDFVGWADFLGKQ